MGKRRHHMKALATKEPAAASPNYHVSDPRVIDAFIPPVTGGRVSITEANALTLSAVWAAVRVISSSVCVLPLHVYRKEAGALSRVHVSGAELPAAKLATDPCPEIARATFWETLVQHVLLWGNAYAEIERNGLGEPIGLWPLMPNAVLPVRDKTKGELAYDCFAAPFQTRIPARNMFHISGLGFDGLRGYSVVQMARRSLNLTATAEQSGEGFFANGMRPGGWLEYPGSFQDLQKLNLKETLKNEHGGAMAFGKAMLLYGGLKYHPIDINPKDAQFLDTRQFQVEEVARWFNIPPHKLHHLLRATFSNIEHQSQEFVTGSLLYWLTKIVEEFRRKLLASAGEEYYAEHLLDALLRGDTVTRYTAYGLGRQWGFLSPNDCRRRENLPEIANGDIYHVPVNMAALGTEPGRQVADSRISRAVEDTVAMWIDADAKAIEQMQADDAEMADCWLSRVQMTDWITAEVLAESSRLAGSIDAQVRIGTHYATFQIARAYAWTCAEQSKISQSCSQFVARMRSAEVHQVLKDRLLLAI